MIVHGHIQIATCFNDHTRFHVDVVNASAAYNNTTAVLDNNYRAKRPVIEFIAGTKLFEFGTEGKQPVDIVDFNATDALSTINGTTGYSTDGYTFINGSRVIFANDSIFSSNFESSKTIPDFLVMQKVCEIFNIGLDYFIEKDKMVFRELEVLNNNLPEGVLENILKRSTTNHTIYQFPRHHRV